MSELKILSSNAENIEEFGMCGYKNTKNEGYKLKLDWIKERFKEGLECKVLHSEKEGAVGAIEYIPAEYAWRPIKAEGFMFIHCIFIIPKKYKEKGNGIKLLEACIDDAKAQGKNGVVVVVRKGTWMAKKELFLRKGFVVVDKAKPDFELLSLKFNEEVVDPCFAAESSKTLEELGKGLVIFTSHQCPYTYKSVTEISEVAKNQYDIVPDVINFSTAKEAQQSPGAFGTFCIAYDGEIIADHPISKTRFQNIMNKILKQ